MLTVPWPRRRLLAWRPELARGVLDLALREVFAWLVAQAEERDEVVDARTGAVTVEQRFGSSLVMNLHFHYLLPDGVRARDEAGALPFHRVRPTPEALETMVRRIAEASERWLVVGQGVDDEEAPHNAQAVLLAASVANQVAAGQRAGQPVRRYRAVPPRFEEVSRSGEGVLCEGYGLHAGTWVPASDRAGLGHACEGSARVSSRRAGRPAAAQTPAGTAAFLFTPLELTEKLAALVVRPRVHTTHFHGVYAAHAAWRSELVPRRLPDAGRDGKTTLLRRPAP
ncbi:MAG: transposase [Alphaproteobacteria bacterium]|nr:transposase [Alphaproteobacteria bacterium]